MVLKTGSGHTHPLLGTAGRALKARSEVNWIKQSGAMSNRAMFAALLLIDLHAHGL